MSTPSTTSHTPAHTSVGRGGDADAPAPITRWEGRLFGALVLAAFPLYGIGSELLDRGLGLGLVLLNSVAVTVIGVVGHRLVREKHPAVGLGYLTARIIEGILLAGGAVLLVAGDVADADSNGYLLAMAVLGIGSVPFFRLLGEEGWLPYWLAAWGIVGYVALTIGVLIELTTGWAVAVVFAVVGGLFELVLGVRLLARGFERLPQGGAKGARSVPTPAEHTAAFRVHLAIAVAATAICVLVNLAVNLAAGLATDLSAWWSMWVVVGCSIGLVVHGLVVHLARLTHPGDASR